MKNLLIISLIIISSCSKKIDLKGEWKASVLVINNSEEKEDPFRAITHFKADNLLFTLKVYTGMNLRKIQLHLLW